jgi:predicted 2-oxoglutarate/Fe(II)-dependent dioxygenase YbiX
MPADRAFFSGETLEPDALSRELYAERRGMVMALDAAPPGMLIVRNYLSADLCRRTVVAGQNAEASSARVLSASGDGGISAREAATRRTDQISASRIGFDARAVVKSAFVELVSTHYRQSIEWFEDPVILRYPEGGEYTAHADAYNWESNQKRWRRSADRDFSMLIYLNEDFEGGKLEFKYYDFKIEPCAGLLVVFPSDWRYAHAAQPVTSGMKFSIVSFAAAQATPKLFDPPPHAIRL